jgi:hypothetical protein
MNTASNIYSLDRRIRQLWESASLKSPIIAEMIDKPQLDSVAIGEPLSLKISPSRSLVLGVDGGMSFVDPNGSAIQLFKGTLIGTFWDEIR